MARFTLEQCLVCCTHTTHRIRLDSGHQRTYVRKLRYAVLVRIYDTVCRYRTGSLRICFYIHNSICNTSQEITVAIFTEERNLLGAIDIDHHLPCEILLGYHPFVNSSLVCLYD